MKKQEIDPEKLFNTKEYNTIIIDANGKVADDSAVAKLVKLLSDKDTRVESLKTLKEENCDQLLVDCISVAEDLIDIGPSSWNLTTIKDIYNYAPSDWDNGYQSFFLPQNQYKGIGVGFKEVNSANAYPIVQFTNISGMKNVLVALGL